MIKKVPELKKIQEYLFKASQCGFITRQELVSMIPPLFLDIQPTDLVLDVCAAPGSKTSQILEFLASMGQMKGSIPEGGVMANEVDFQRAYLLAHQLKRLNSPSMAVINHDAQCLPTIYNESISDKDNKVYFDKVLADVPCSGDGALRKLPARWRYWSAHDALHLYKTQVQILTKAVQLVKVGGLVVYSTCSLNAVENEAVVAEVLRKGNQNQNDCLELIDITNSLDGFKVRKGLNKWKFIVPKRKAKGVPKDDQADQISLNKNGNIDPSAIFDNFYTYEEFSKQYAKHPKLSKSVTKDMFSNDTEELENTVHLERTVRILPQDNNSGGFYVALIRKNKHVHFDDGKIEETIGETEIKEETIEVTKMEEETIAATDIKGETEAIERNDCAIDPKTKSSYRLAKAKHLAVIKQIDTTVIDEIKTQYGLIDSFPYDQLITSAEPGRRIQLISKRVRDFLNADTKKQIKFVNIGTSLFIKNKSGGEFWRLSQNGIHLVKPYMTKNVIDISKEFFLFLVKNPQSVPFSAFGSEFEKERKQMEELEIDCYCFCYKEKEEELLCIIKMKQSLVMFVAKEDVEGLRMKYLE